MMYRKELLEKLEMLDRELKVEGIEYRVPILIFGSSAILLGYNPKKFHPTRDIDIVTWDGTRPDRIPVELKKIFETYELNDDVIVFINEFWELDLFKCNITTFEKGYDKLEIFIPTQTLITFTKFLAWRGRSTRDDSDDVSIPEIYNHIDFEQLDRLVKQYLKYSIYSNSEKGEEDFLRLYKFFLEEIHKKGKEN